MPASDDPPGPAASTPHRIEIGPAPTGDHTRRWIRLGLLALAGLLALWVLLRLRRAR